MTPLTIDELFRKVRELTPDALEDAIRDAEQTLAQLRAARPLVKASAAKPRLTSETRRPRKRKAAEPLVPVLENGEPVEA